MKKRDRESGTGTSGAGESGADAATPGTAQVQDVTGARQNAVHEAYSFACMRCGHGWERDYEIVHLTYPDGRPLIVYYANGERVLSPLKHPTCPNCDGHVVRIMRSGRVSTAEAAALPFARSR